MRVVVALIAVSLFAAVAHAGRVDGSVFLMPVDSAFTSVGHAEYFNDINQPDSATLSGTHAVSGAATFTHAVSGDGSYSYHLQGPADPGACYGTSLDVVADPPGLLNTVTGRWVGDSRCAPPPQQPGDVGSGQTQNGGGCNACAGNDSSTWTPIVINRQAGSFPLSSFEQGVAFDVDASGARRRTSWTRAESQLEFLWLDRNHDGVITDASELFGSATVLRSGTRARHGFEALRELDGDGDGDLDSHDASWPQLKLWRDADHDGVSQHSEIALLTESAVERLEIESRWSGRRDANGNLLRYQASLVLQNDIRRTYYDVLFVLQ